MLIDFVSWDSWIRTSDTRYQKPMPYHLAISQWCDGGYRIRTYEPEGMDLQSTAFDQTSLNPHHINALAICIASTNIYYTEYLFRCQHYFLNFVLPSIKEVISRPFLQAPTVITNAGVVVSNPIFFTWQHGNVNVAVKDMTHIVVTF